MAVFTDILKYSNIYENYFKSSSFILSLVFQVKLFDFMYQNFPKRRNN